MFLGCLSDALFFGVVFIDMLQVTDSYNSAACMGDVVSRDIAIVNVVFQPTAYKGVAVLLVIAARSPLT